MRALRTNGLDNPYPFEFAKKFIEHGAREERRTEKICNKIKWLSYQTPTVLDEMLDVLLDGFWPADCRKSTVFIELIVIVKESLGGVGAGEGNRTLVISLEGCCSTIELHPQEAEILENFPVSLQFKSAKNRRLIVNHNLRPSCKLLSIGA
jgi:hypothetical protein